MLHHCTVADFVVSCIVGSVCSAIFGFKLAVMLWPMIGIH